MCDCNCSPRLDEPAKLLSRTREERVIFRWRHFLLLTYLVVTASTAQLCLMTQDEIRGRTMRESQKTQKRLRAADGATKQNVGKSYSKTIPQTLTPATVKRELETSKQPPKGGWLVRISDCPHVMETRAFRENAHLDWMTCLSCGARWSRTTGPDDIQMKRGLDVIQPITTPPCPSCGKPMKYQQTLDKEEMFFGCNQIPQCRRVVRVPPTTASLILLSVPSCSVAQPLEIQATKMDIESVSSEDSFSMWEVSADAQQENDFLFRTTLVSFVSWNQREESAHSNSSVVPRPTEKGHGRSTNQKTAGYFGTKVSHSDVLRSACLWNHKAPINDTMWEAAVQNFGSVSVPQPPVSDDSIFGETLVQLSKTKAVLWNLL